MLLIAAALLMAPVAEAGPPQAAGTCKWVRGRFDVWNGSSVRRIWVIGTHRLIALRDEDGTAPAIIQKYVYAGPFLRRADGLFGYFRVCALERSRPGHMQHVRIVAVKKLVFRGRPFRPIG